MRVQESRLGNRRGLLMYTVLYVGVGGGGCGGSCAILRRRRTTTTTSTNAVPRKRGTPSSTALRLTARPLRHLVAVAALAVAAILAVSAFRGVVPGGGGAASLGAAPGDAASGRGLHSSTSRLNGSASCGIGGASRGCLGSV